MAFDFYCALEVLLYLYFVALCKNCRKNVHVSIRAPFDDSSRQKEPMKGGRTCDENNKNTSFISEAQRTCAIPIQRSRIELKIVLFRAKI